MNESIKDPPINKHYRQLDIEIDSNIIGYIIGNNGTHFKRITNITGVDYIWWEDSIKKIEIWGAENRLDYACKILKDHCNYIINKYNNNN
tara:strand:+ start:771 stop:1040 length:270 start_codon:yes stop_codon:yes gene_type:complete